VLDKVGEQHLIIDLVRISNEISHLSEQYQGICW
jgi:hypothetical protein